MTTLSQIVTRFAEEAGKPGARLLRGTSRSIFVSSSDDRILCSWGEPFPLAQIMPGEHGSRSWWLLNGDTYTASTASHQRLVREACEKTRMPALIVPFSCLSAAGIDRETIEPVDIKDDEWRDITRYTAAQAEEFPWPHMAADTWQLPDGRWAWTARRHMLGASLFRASYTAWDEQTWERVTRAAYFLSAFDQQEPSPLYFLCQLPDGAAPVTVGQALEALKPPEVTAAEAAGLTVTRQGDLFAVPAGRPTREIPGQTARGGRLLGTSHTATEVRVAGDGTTYARGILRHAPPHRRPEHVRQPMGDRKTWHRIVRNTVPLDRYGNQRSWSRAGNVD
jgi:hypothetical protein